MSVFRVMVAVVGYGRGNRGKQVIPIHGLLQVGRGAECPHPLLRAGFIIGSDDDDWHRDVAIEESLQHVESVDGVHM